MKVDAAESEHERVVALVTDCGGKCTENRRVTLELAVATAEVEGKRKLLGQLETDVEDLDRWCHVG